MFRFPANISPTFWIEEEPVKKILFLLLCAPLMMAADCDDKQPAMSDTGIKKATVKGQTDPEGYSVEQRNVMERVARDNKPGSVKHLYVISAMSGQVLLYSTVKGKVTSSGKRLTPNSVTGSSNGTTYYTPMRVNIGGEAFTTNEVLQDDGTYGSSVEYLYWFDVRGVYHQHYVSGGQILHVSDQPIAVKDIVLNLESASH